MGDSILEGLNACFLWEIEDLKTKIKTFENFEDKIYKYSGNSMHLRELGPSMTHLAIFHV